MKVSVIIPAIDEAAAISGAVASAVAAGAWEVIVADGGSQDDTAERARQGGAQIVTSAPGRAVQQNAGAAVATGDVLLFLHADCGLPVDGLQEVGVRLQQSPEAVAGWFRQRIDHPGRIYRWIEAGNQLRVRITGWAYGDQAIFVRRDVFRRIGCFDEIPLMEDLYLMKRLKRQGALVCVPQRLHVSARRWVVRGTVRQTLRNWAMLLAVHVGVPPHVLIRYYPRTT